MAADHSTMTQIRLTNEQREIALDLLHLFKIDGKPADEVATEGQIQIFAAIVFRLSTRMHIMVSTQYGKSLFVALACIVLSCLEDELCTVVAPTDDKAAIIMRYYIAHIGDNVLFSEKLDKSTKIERLEMETTKDRIVLRKNPETNKSGGIFIISVQAGNSKKGFAAAMGEGSKVVIQDESGLIPDENESTAYRMIAGKGDEVMYVKIGNPWFKDPPHSHFFKSYRDPRYLKIDIDYEQGLAEGRYMQEFIDEAKGKPFFSILYENKFPDTKVMDNAGFLQLITQATLDNAYVPSDINFPLIGEKRMGIDLAGGGANESVICVRGDNAAKIVWRHPTEDPLIVLTKAEEIAKQEGIPLDDRYIFPDKTGAVAFCARANELWPMGKDGHDNRFGFIAGGKPEEDDDASEFVLKKNGDKESIYLNARAQITMRAKRWMERGGKLIGKPDFDEALIMRYKVQSDKKIVIISKKDLRENGIESPDRWDAFAMTFARKPDNVIHKTFKQKPYQPSSNYGI